MKIRSEAFNGLWESFRLEMRAKRFITVPRLGNVDLIFERKEVHNNSPPMKVVTIKHLRINRDDNLLQLNGETPRVG